MSRHDHGPDDPLVRNLPPHDAEAERQLIARALLDTRTFGDLELPVQPEWFYDRWLGTVWRSMQALLERGWPINAHSVVDAMRHFAGDLPRDEHEQRMLNVELARVQDLYDAAPSSSNVNWFAQKVRDAYVSRELVKAGAWITDLGWERTPITERLDRAMEWIDLVAQCSTGEIREANATQLVQLVQARLERLRQGVDPAPQSGYGSLDDLVRGFQPGEFTVLAARPSMGKTTLLFSLLRRMARAGTPVGCVSLETPNEQIGINWVASRAELDSRALRDGYVPRRDPPALVQAYESIAELGDLFRTVDKGVRTVTDFRRVVRTWKHRHGVKVVAVDYLQLLHGSAESRKRGRYEEISYVSTQLKDIASSMDLHVIALAQLSRAVEQRHDKSPMLSDLKDSGQIEQDADVVMLLHRPGYYDRDADPLEAQLRVAKNRNGPVGAVQLEFQREHNSFREPSTAGAHSDGPPGDPYDPGHD